MFCGTLVMEDTTLTFNMNVDLIVRYTVCDSITGENETFEVPQDKFFKALAIAVHNDGMPDWKTDYADAESIQGKIRWIP